MISTENYKGIKLDMQAVDMTLTPQTKEVIHEAVDKMSRHAHDIRFVDVYMKNEPHAVNAKSVHIRVGLPNGDAFAEDAGAHFDPLIRSVADKLIRQLDHKKTKHS